jgi:NAD+ synthase (glutamine-hydrolysing)
MESYKQYVRIGVTALCNHPLDFEGNAKRIIDSIKICKEEKCTMRVGGELEVSGYVCEDHFFEHDTMVHSWEVV